MSVCRRPGSAAAEGGASGKTNNVLLRTELFVDMAVDIGASGFTG